MQKIQLYLVKNRITVTTDLVAGGFNTEYRKVYQRNLKIYKGIDNTIELDIRNSDQKKQNVIGKEVDMKFFDTERNLLFVATGYPIVNKPGLMSVTISRFDIENIQPQLIHASAFLARLDEYTGEQLDEILYVDGQFGLFANVELIDGYNTKSSTIEELTVFNYEFDRKEYVSEIGKFGNRTNDDYAVAPSARSITVSAEGPYQGTIIAEVTAERSMASSNTWTRILPTTQSTDWDTRQTPEVSYTGNWRFIRFRFGGQSRGLGAAFNITTSEDVYTSVSVIHRGQDYKSGDLLLIRGSKLGGDDGINDLYVTVNETNQYPRGSINSINGISWSGVAASSDVAYYRNVTAETVGSKNIVTLIKIKD